MIADAGFEVEGAEQVTLPEHRVGGGGCHQGADTGCHDSAAGGCHEGAGVCGSAPAEPAGEPVAANEPRTDLVAVRRRGAGTDLAPNA